MSWAELRLDERRGVGAVPCDRSAGRILSPRCRMSDRRSFVTSGSRAVMAGLLWRTWPEFRASLQTAGTARAHLTPEQLASDETYWGLVAQAFVVDGRYAVLNGGGQNPPVRATLDALTRGEAYAAAQPRPNNYTLLAQIEAHRLRLARHLGVTADEVAITRNTTEGTNIVVHGVSLGRGDEVVLSPFEADYAALALRTRVARDGVRTVIAETDIPPSDDAVVAAFSRSITPRTRLLICSHIADGWGFVLPIARLAELARRAQVPLLCDGALSFGAVPVNVRTLGCDYYVSSLHKWLGAPLGTGVLVVDRTRLATTWPLYGSDINATDIRKFEDIGTRPGASIAAIGQALDFHETIGPEQKAARITYLLGLAIDPLAGLAGVAVFSDAMRTRRSLARVTVLGWSGTELTKALQERYGLYTYGGFRDRWGGCYISPNLFNTPTQMARFAAAIRDLAQSPKR
jgi:isopenicillin-N epimerase